MRYVDEYRDGAIAVHLAEKIASRVGDREYRLMEFCGGHTHAIFRYGLADLLPPSIRLIHGPGCPVCVLPAGRIDGAISLSKEAILTTYADMMRVPASNGMSLYKARAEGADIRMVYSPMDALKIARENRAREVVFFAIGFETTTPPTALAIRQAKSEGLSNFSVYCNHVLTPPALLGILDSGASIDGVIGPSHVSAVIGTGPYDFVPGKYGKPVVIAGFEPLDVMQAVLMLVEQINSGKAMVENEYSRAVDREGNPKAQKLIEEVFETRDAFEWRGLGWMERSARRVAPAYSDHDAEVRFDVPVKSAADHKACECG
ncbi:MAG TPA: hydrogenase formation protein HypD, partial [Burkholderiales bacterium]|nr:hydrogenase formation protein HypD [Burkholderiales bacterium]